MDWKDTVKHVGDQGRYCLFLFRQGMPGQAQSSGSLSKYWKKPVTQFEGWRFCLSTFALICVFKHQYHKELHPSWNLTHSPHFSLSPSGVLVHPRPWLNNPRRTSPFGAPHPLSGVVPVPCGDQKKSHTFFGVSGQKARVRRLFA